jgi:YD repeat-containing protein
VPRKIANALGQVTQLSRRDIRWPARVTRLERANGAVTLAEYDTLGRPSKTIAMNPLDDNRHAVTRYEWNRFDFVTKIVQPQLDSLVLEYDASTGNRIWQQDARGSSSRVNFRYYTSGRIAGLLRAVELPGGIKDSVVYDSLGNLATTTSARYGAATRYDNDLLGRVTRVRSPIDSLGTGDPQTDSLYYDLMDRVLRKVSIGHEMNGVGEQRLVVLTGYDQEGQVDTVRRFAEPDAADIDTIRTTWTYDAAGRALTEKAPDGSVESRQYDHAGNATQITTRRGHVITMAYDALNRLTKRVVPADTFAKRRGHSCVANGVPDACGEHRLSAVPDGFDRCLATLCHRQGQCALCV